MSGRHLPATWAEDQILSDSIVREERIARAWIRNYEAHVANEKEAELARTKLRAEYEKAPVSVPPSRCALLSTGTKGRIAGYAGHVPGAKHVRSVQSGEYADHRFATQFDGQGHATATDQHLTALELEVSEKMGKPTAVAAALPHEVDVHVERTSQDIASAPPVADLLGADQQAHVSDTLRYLRTHYSATYSGHIPGSSSVVGL
ncbi:uncharacterized protein AMSG_05530 [Thecamonas trahens ATCC 50062]|uniref:Uncharacterized protein n=1 Tax=Thecamonas trahens ATCC 50062 TaxID=461836 RepID=A0A0L0DB03_THETB|nr:hypothetical protein AMSG_05530 [Thecamonas trahens ATCC 50062]KNC49512.1 hypothetical protein AMSG_05530 [Thecamonas trahens ATCC 50062]|eukprot:XP_013757629.1 hypothetical protein AMSG_05530 [Thecamonas trahens ATCC 50062]